MSSEHRNETRQRVFLKGRIVFNNGASSMDCLVRDFSSSGARLALSESSTLPEVFDLYIPQKDRTYRSTLRWRRADGVGITFADEAAKPAS
ncbi:PilZ domain-containing protein, partial [Methylobacterium sp. WL122]